MDTTEKALATKTAREITVREISRAAGTHESMISYYFGSKDGLLVTMFHNKMKNFPMRADKDIIDLCICKKSIRPMVDCLFEFYYSHPSLTRMCIVELLSNSSEIKDIHNVNYNKSTHTIVRDAIKALSDSDIYQKNIDLAFASVMILGMILGPILQTNAEQVLEMPTDVGSSDWPELVARTIDSAFSI
jgi:AcrR family transcriptional regulator